MQGWGEDRIYLYFTRKKSPYRVIIAIITIGAFLFNIFGTELAWAQNPTGSVLPPTSTRAEGSPGHILSKLEPSQFKLPTTLGSVKEAHTGYNKKTVIHIQDAHCNYSAQESVKDIIEFLNTNYGVDLVTLEGGEGDYDFSVFTDIEDLKLREKVARYFTKEGRINGAELASIMNPGMVTLKGIEKARLYKENLDVYKDHLKHKDSVDQILDQIDSHILEAKDKTYSNRLKEFDAKSKAYHSQRLSFKEYLNYILSLQTKVGDKAIQTHKNLSQLTEIIEEEHGIDFKTCDREKEEIIRELKNILPKSELKNLVKWTMQFKTGLLKQDEFYLYLLEKAKFNSINISKYYPNLIKYSRFLRKYESLDKEKVFSEFDELEKYLFTSLLETKDQRKLYELSRDFDILKRLFNANLSKKEFDYYLKNKRNFKGSRFFNNDTNASEICKALDAYRANFEKFYTVSLKRDKAFMKNVKTYMKNKDTAVLFTGGFHTENLKELLKKQGYSYIVILPKFDPTEKTPYFKLLSGGLSPIEEEIREKISSIAIPSPNNHLVLYVYGTKEGGLRREIFKQAVEEVSAVPTGEKLRMSPVTALSDDELKDAIILDQDSYHSRARSYLGKIITPLFSVLFIAFAYLRFIHTDDHDSFVYPNLTSGTWLSYIDRCYFNDAITIPAFTCILYLFNYVLNIINVIIYKFRSRTFKEDPKNIAYALYCRQNITGLWASLTRFILIVATAFMVINEAFSEQYDVMRHAYESLKGTDLEGVGISGGAGIIGTLQKFSGTYDSNDIFILIVTGAFSYILLTALLYTLSTYRSSVKDFVVGLIRQDSFYNKHQAREIVLEQGKHGHISEVRTSPIEPNRRYFLKTSAFTAAGIFGSLATNAIAGIGGTRVTSKKGPLRPRQYNRPQVSVSKLLEIPEENLVKPIDNTRMMQNLNGFRLPSDTDPVQAYFISAEDYLFRWRFVRELIEALRLREGVDIILLASKMEDAQLAWSDIQRLYKDDNLNRRIKILITNCDISRYPQDMIKFLVDEKRGLIVPVSPRRIINYNGQKVHSQGGSKSIGEKVSGSDLGKNVVGNMYKTNLHMAGGDIVADDTFLYTTQVTIDISCADEEGNIIYTAEEIIAELERLSGKKVIVLPSFADPHCDRFLIPLGVVNGKRTCGMANPLQLLEIIGSMSEAEKNNALKEAKTFLERVEFKHFKKILNSIPQTIEKLKKSTYFKELENVRKTLRSHDITIVDIPAIHSVWEKHKHGMEVFELPFGFYYTNSEQDTFKDSITGKARRTIIAPRYGIDKLDNHIASIYKEFGFEVIQITSIEEGRLGAGIRCDVSALRGKVGFDASEAGVPWMIPAAATGVVGAGAALKWFLNRRDRIRRKQGSRTSPVQGNVNQHVLQTLRNLNGPEDFHNLPEGPVKDTLLWMAENNIKGWVIGGAVTSMLMGQKTSTDVDIAIDVRRLPLRDRAKTVFRNFINRVTGKPLIVSPDLRDLSVVHRIEKLFDCSIKPDSKKPLFLNGIRLDFAGSIDGNNILYRTGYPVRAYAPSIYNVGISTSGEFFESKNAVTDIDGGILNLEPIGGLEESAAINKGTMLEVMRLLGEKHRRGFTLTTKAERLVFCTTQAQRNRRRKRLLREATILKKSHPELQISLSEPSISSDRMGNVDIPDISDELRFFDVELYIAFSKAVDPFALAGDLEKAGLGPVIEKLFDVSPEILADQAVKARTSPMEDHNDLDKFFISLMQDILDGMIFTEGEEVIVEGKAFEIVEVRHNLSFDGELEMNEQERLREYYRRFLEYDKFQYYAVGREVSSGRKVFLAPLQSIPGRAAALRTIRDISLEAAVEFLAIGPDGNGNEILVTPYLETQFRTFIESRTTHSLPRILDNAIALGEDMIKLEENGLSHGDLVSHNVFVENEKWRVTDFADSLGITDVSGLASLLYAATTGIFLNTFFSTGWVYINEDGILQVLNILDGEEEFPHIHNTEIPEELSYIIWDGLVNRVTLTDFVKKLRAISKPNQTEDHTSPIETDTETQKVTRRTMLGIMTAAGALIAIGDTKGALAVAERTGLTPAQYKNYKSACEALKRVLAVTDKNASKNFKLGVIYLMLATAVHESNLEKRWQVGYKRQKGSRKKVAYKIQNGARGLWQIEPDTAYDMVRKYLQVMDEENSLAVARAPDELYTLQKGDNYSKVAKKFYGTSSKCVTDFLEQKNGIPSRKLTAGQKIKIPRITINYALQEAAARFAGVTRQKLLLMSKAQIANLIETNDAFACFITRMIYRKNGGDEEIGRLPTKAQIKTRVIEIVGEARGRKPTKKEEKVGIEVLFINRCAAIWHKYYNRSKKDVPEKKRRFVLLAKEPRFALNRYIATVLIAIGITSSYAQAGVNTIVQSGISSGISVVWMTLPVIGILVVMITRLKSGLRIQREEPYQELTYNEIAESISQPDRSSPMVATVDAIMGTISSEMLIIIAIVAPILIIIGFPHEIIRLIAYLKDFFSRKSQEDILAETLAVLTFGREEDIKRVVRITRRLKRDDAAETLVLMANMHLSTYRDIDSINMQSLRDVVKAELRDRYGIDIDEYESSQIQKDPLLQEGGPLGEAFRHILYTNPSEDSIQLRRVVERIGKALEQRLKERFGNNLSIAITPRGSVLKGYASLAAGITNKSDLEVIIVIWGIPSPISFDLEQDIRRMFIDISRKVLGQEGLNVKVSKTPLCTYIVSPQELLGKMDHANILAGKVKPVTVPTETKAKGGLGGLFTIPVDAKFMWIDNVAMIFAPFVSVTNPDKLKQLRKDIANGLQERVKKASSYSGDQGWDKVWGRVQEEWSKEINMGRSERGRPLPDGRRDLALPTLDKIVEYLNQPETSMADLEQQPGGKSQEDSTSPIEVKELWQLYQKARSIGDANGQMYAIDEAIRNGLVELGDPLLRDYLRQLILYPMREGATWFLDRLYPEIVGEGDISITPGSLPGDYNLNSRMISALYMYHLGFPNFEAGIEVKAIIPGEGEQWRMGPRRCELVMLPGGQTGVTKMFPTPEDMLKEVLPKGSIGYAHLHPVNHDARPLVPSAKYDTVLHSFSGDLSPDGLYTDYFDAAVTSIGVILYKHREGVDRQYLEDDLRKYVLERDPATLDVVNVWRTLSNVRGLELYFVPFNLKQEGDKIQVFIPDNILVPAPPDFADIFSGTEPIDGELSEFDIRLREPLAKLKALANGPIPTGDQLNQIRVLMREVMLVDDELDDQLDGAAALARHYVEQTIENIRRSAGEAEDEDSPDRKPSSDRTSPMIGDVEVPQALIDKFGREHLEETHENKPTEFKDAINAINRRLGIDVFIQILNKLIPNLGEDNIKHAFKNDPYGFAIAITVINDLKIDVFMQTLTELTPRLGGEDNIKHAFRNYPCEFAHAIEEIHKLGIDVFIDKLIPRLGEDNVKHVFRNNPRGLRETIISINRLGIDVFIDKLIPKLEEDNIKHAFRNDPNEFARTIDYINHLKIDVFIQILNKLIPELGEDNIKHVFRNNPRGLRETIISINRLGIDVFIDKLIPKLGEDNIKHTFRNDPIGFAETVIRIDNLKIDIFIQILDELIPKLEEDNIKHAFRNDPSGFVSAITVIDSLKIDVFQQMLTKLMPKLGEDNIKHVFRNNPYEFIRAMLSIKGLGIDVFIDKLIPKLEEDNIKHAFRNDPYGFAETIISINNLGIDVFIDKLIPKLEEDNIKHAFRNNPNGFALAIVAINNLGIDVFIDKLIPKLEEDNIKHVFRNNPYEFALAIIAINNLGIDVFIDKLIPILGEDGVKHVFRSYPKGFANTITAINNLGIDNVTGRVIPSFNLFRLRLEIRTLSLSEGISLSDAAITLVAFEAEEAGQGSNGVITDVDGVKSLITRYNAIEAMHSGLTTSGAKIHLYRRKDIQAFSAEELTEFQSRAAVAGNMAGIETRPTRLLKDMEEVELELLLPPSFSSEVTAGLLYHMIERGFLDRTRYAIEVQLTFEGDLTDKAKFISFTMLAARPYEPGFPEKLVSLMGPQSSVLIPGAGVLDNIRGREGASTERRDYLGLIIPHYDPTDPNLIHHMGAKQLIYGLPMTLPDGREVKVPIGIQGIIKNVQLLNFALLENLKPDSNRTKNSEAAHLYEKFCQTVIGTATGYGISPDAFNVRWLGEIDGTENIWDSLYPHLNSLHQTKMDNGDFRREFTALFNTTAEAVEQTIRTSPVAAIDSTIRPAIPPAIIKMPLHNNQTAAGSITINNWPEPATIKDITRISDAAHKKLEANQAEREKFLSMIADEARSEEVIKYLMAKAEGLAHIDPRIIVVAHTQDGQTGKLTRALEEISRITGRNNGYANYIKLCASQESAEDMVNMYSSKHPAVIYEPNYNSGIPLEVQLFAFIVQLKVLTQLKNIKTLTKTVVTRSAQIDLEGQQENLDLMLGMTMNCIPGTIPPMLPQVDIAVPPVQPINLNTAGKEHRVAEEVKTGA